MTPAKRRPATPASQGPTRTAPDVPVVGNPGPAKTKGGTQPLDAEGEPVADSAPRTETGQEDAEEGATTRSRGRSRTFYPLPVWPD